MPLDMLRDEHVVILRVVDALERWLNRLEAGKSAPAETLENAVAFIKGFADGCHHRKEEDLLFPALEEGGPFGPVAVMLEEHDEGRSYVRGLTEGLHHLESDSGRKSVLTNGRQYVALLRAHIDKENEVLFPLSERMLSDDAMHGLAHAFEDMEAEQAGDHERFLALAAEIERGANA
jgi:hemerythrin-like domain-containing protein